MAFATNGGRGGLGSAVSTPDNGSDTSPVIDRAHALRERAESGGRRASN